MSPMMAEVMMAWEGFRAASEFGFLDFKSVAHYSQVDLKHIRRTVRALARAGYFEFGKGLYNDDGEFAGAGYCLTTKGEEYLDEVEKLRSERK